MNHVLAYDEMWLKLRARIERMAAEEAVRAAVAIDEIKVRRAQGAHEMCKTLVAVMDEIKSLEQHGTTAFEDEDDQLKH